MSEGKGISCLPAQNARDPSSAKWLGGAAKKRHQAV